MVRRGSTVRVRQRALQNPRSWGFFVQNDLLFVVRAVGMEPFMELSRTRLDLFRAKERGRVGAVACSYRRLCVGRSPFDLTVARLTHGSEHSIADKELSAL